MYLYILVWINGCVIGILTGLLGGLAIARNNTTPYMYLNNMCASIHNGIKVIHEYYLDHQQEIELSVDSIVKTITPILNKLNQLAFLYKKAT